MSEIFTAAVIPAKAGIQLVIKSPHSGQSRVLGVVPLVELLAIRLGCQKTSAKSLVMRGILSIVWIPASAGMTEWHVSHAAFNYIKLNGNE
jgi:hypothetical protein